MGLWGLNYFFILFSFGLLSFVFFHYHYIYMLLSVEFMMLSLYFIFSFSSYHGLGGLFILFLFLILMVCGAAYGISLLIFYVRYEGLEFFSSYLNSF